MTQPYVGVPTAVVTCDVGAPGMIYTDRGRENKNDPVARITRLFDINRLEGRPARPRDRPEQERGFLSIKDQLIGGLPGFLGGSPAERGEASDKEDLLLVSEATELIESLILGVYDVIPHGGLRMPRQAGPNRSPAYMRAAGFRRSEVIRLPPDATAPLLALPIFWRAIDDNGISIRGLAYDDPVLKPFRGVSSSLNPAWWAGAKGEARPRDRRDRRGRWPFFRHKHDAARVWFQHPKQRTVHEIECTDLETGYVPLSDYLIGYVKDMLPAGLPRKTRRELLVENLNRILRAYELDSPLRAAERRALAKNRRRAAPASDAVNRALNSAVIHTVETVGALTEDSALDGFDPLEELAGYREWIEGEVEVDP